MELAHRLRHHVFCEELCWFSPQDNLLEQDQFDDYAHNILVQDELKNQLLATVRLICPNTQGTTLPIYFHGGGHYIRPDLHPLSFPANDVCEVSRMAISSEFRTLKSLRALSKRTIGINFDDAYTVYVKETPPLALTLYISVASITFSSERPHVYFTIEKRLARNLSRLGVPIVQITNEYDYLGKRANYYVNTLQFIDQLDTANRSIFNQLTQARITAQSVLRHPL